MHASTLLAALALLAAPASAGYVLQDDYFASGNFFSNFQFFTGADPTHGFVQYQNATAAKSLGLITTGSGSAQMRVDSKNVQPNGRPSVRLTSNKAYSTGLIIADIYHMPGGVCGTWPAFWMFGPNWPNSGEIDIVEGVNDGSLNQVTLHTGATCSVSNSGFSGTFLNGNCQVAAGNGCDIQAKNTNTYGAAFNSANGGVYATQITSSAISVWFFPRGQIPSDITQNAPNPTRWGTPLARFAGACSIPNAFMNMNLVFDTTFCGDWAGGVWSQSATCAAKASSCAAYVANNPAAFAGAYWDIRGLKVYKSTTARMARDVEGEGEIELDREEFAGEVGDAEVPVSFEA